MAQGIKRLTDYRACLRGCEIVVCTNCTPCHKPLERCIYSTHMHTHICARRESDLFSVVGTTGRECK